MANWRTRYSLGSQLGAGQTATVFEVWSVVEMLEMFFKGYQLPSGKRSHSWLENPAFLIGNTSSIRVHFLLLC